MRDASCRKEKLLARAKPLLKTNKPPIPHKACVMWRYFFLIIQTIKINYMKTAASYIKKKYDCYKGYSEKSIREVCHIWCEVIEEAQNDVKKEFEENNRWIPISEKLPPLNEYVLFKYSEGEYCVGCLNNYGYYCSPYIPSENDFASIHLLSEVTHWRSFL